MRNIQATLIILLAFVLASCGSESQSLFEVEKASPDWELRLSDPCTGNWQDRWFLDGKLATISHDEEGMDFSAGPVNREDAHHAVLWTRAIFKGDLKIEYTYTRTDERVVNVNILYLQAQGTGEEGFDKDITRWNEFREVPTMSKYFTYMDPLHISYAAFPMVNEDPENDYIRVRKYPDVEGFDKMWIAPDYFRTGLFLPGVSYQITVIKTGSDLWFQVDGPKRPKLYSWKLEAGQSPLEGRIGLRHMYTRSARYSDFKVYTK